MDKATVEPQLKAVMDAVPVCEGVVFSNLEGKVVVGQTLLADTDQSGIAKAVGVMFKPPVPAAKKGKVLDLTIGLEKGYIVAVCKNTDLILGLLGEDGKSSVGLLMRQLKNLVK
jgi:hypothetical protein